MNIFGHTMLETLLKRGVHIKKIYTIHPMNAAKISDYKDFRPLAKKYNILLVHVKHIREAKEDIRALKPRHIFVFGWSQLLDEDLLSMATCGVLGSHPALLPKNRGRAAIPWHILNNEKMGGITFFYIDEGCDSGPIVAQKGFALDPRMTATEYYKRILTLGMRAITSIAPRLALGEKLPARRQNHLNATYLTKRTLEDGKIDWKKPATDIERLVRALTRPYPGAWTLSNRKTIIIDSAHLIKRKSAPLSPGTVVEKTNRGMVVQTGQGFLEITGVRKGKISVTPRIRVGTQFGT